MKSARRRVWTTAALGALILLLYAMLADREQEGPPLPREEEASSRKAHPMLEGVAKPVASPAARAERMRTTVSAVDPRGRRLATIHVGLPSGVRVEQETDSHKTISWPQGQLIQLAVSASACLPTTLTLDDGLGPQVVVVLQGNAVAHSRRIDVEARLFGVRGIQGARATATSKDGKVLTGLTGKYGQISFDTGDEAGTTWASLVVTYRDKYENSWRFTQAELVIPAFVHARLRGPGQIKLKAILHDDIALPLPHRLINFALVDLVSGRNLGGGGDSKKRTRVITGLGPGRYRVLAVGGGRLLAQADVEIEKGGGTTEVVLEPVSQPSLDCRLSPELASRFGSLLLCPKSLAESSAGAQAREYGVPQEPEAQASALWSRRHARLVEANEHTQGKVRCPLPELEDSWAYLFAKDRNFLARAEVLLANQRDGTIFLDLPQDAAPLGHCVITLAGDLGPIEEEGELRVTISGHVGRVYSGPLTLEGRRLILPPLPPGTYKVELGMQLEGRLVSPITPRSLEVLSPPTPTSMRWVLRWPPK